MNTLLVRKDFSVCHVIDPQHNQIVEENVREGFPWGGNYPVILVENTEENCIFLVVDAYGHLVWINASDCHFYN